MKDRDSIWYDNEVRKLKEEKKEVLNDIKGDDFCGNRFDTQNRKSIKEDFKRKRRSIKRSEKQNVKQFIENELNK